MIPELEKPKLDKDFNPVQQQLLTELQHWRREKAAAEKIPVYIIATNKELVNIVGSAPSSLEGLRLIQGFGQKKTQRHGQEILEIVRRFTANASEQPEAHSGRGDAGDGN